MANRTPGPTVVCDVFHSAYQPAGFCHMIAWGFRMVWGFLSKSGVRLHFLQRKRTCRLQRVGGTQNRVKSLHPFKVPINLPSLASPILYSASFSERKLFHANLRVNLRVKSTFDSWCFLVRVNRRLDPLRWPPPSLTKITKYLQCNYGFYQLFLG